VLITLNGLTNQAKVNYSRKLKEPGQPQRPTSAASNWPISKSGALSAEVAAGGPTGRHRLQRRSWCGSFRAHGRMWVGGPRCDPTLVLGHMSGLMGCHTGQDGVGQNETGAGQGPCGAAGNCPSTSLDELKNIHGLVQILSVAVPAHLRTQMVNDATEIKLHAGERGWP